MTYPVSEIWHRRFKMISKLKDWYELLVMINLGLFVCSLGWWAVFGPAIVYLSVEYMVLNGVSIFGLCHTLVGLIFIHLMYLGWRD